jgi:hypothetical protein
LASSLRRLLGEVGDRQADHLAVRDRVDTEAGGADRLFDGVEVGAVPHLHRQHARLGHRHGRNLVDRHVGAVNIDIDAIEQRGRRATCAQAAQIVLERVHGAGHRRFTSALS